MDTLITKFGEYGIAGVSLGFIIGYFYLEIKDMKATMKEDNKWKMQVIENDTKATIESTNAQIASTKALEALSEMVRNLEGRAK